MVNEDLEGKPQRVERLEKDLGFSLPEMLALLYRDADGGSDDDVDACGYRLLSVDQVKEEVDAFAGIMPLLGGVPFFTDDNGSYLFVFLSGPLEGRVAVLVEGYAYCTAFRSVTSLLKQLDAVGDDDWEENLYGDYFTGCLPFYPQRVATPEQIAADREASQQLRELWEQDRTDASYDQGHDEIYLTNIITLTPWEDAQSVREYLRGDYPDQFAIEWAGFAGDRLVEDLAKVAETFQCGLAYQSLAQIGTARAKEILLRQVPRCPKGHEATLARVVDAIGVSTRHEIAEKQKHVYLVQNQSGDDWIVIGTSNHLIRHTEQPIVVWRESNQQGVEVSLALTSSAIKQLKKQIESSPEPDKAWVRWQFVSRLASQYGQKVGFQVTKLISPKMTRHETPYFQLAIDPETRQELDEIGRFGPSNSECTQLVFDYVDQVDGTSEFVWLRD